MYRMKSERKKQILHMNTSMWNLEKCCIDDLICKAKVETQTERTNVWTPARGKGEWV